MKTRREPRAKTPRKETARADKTLEVAMEHRAREIHPLVKKGMESEELTNWTDAEADMLEG